MDLPETFDEFVSPSFCNHKGCGKPARWGLRMKVWAKGYSKDTTPLEMALSLKVCDDHRNEIDPKTFWLPETKAMITGALEILGKAEPDFSSTEFYWEPIKAMN